ALARDLGAKEKELSASSKEWLGYWNKNPVAAYTGLNKNESNAWFVERDQRLIPSFEILIEERNVFEAHVMELCELRMAEYIARAHY
ncbi:MAG: DEAD/DEAH box helicase, partial [Aliidiomarina sp.]